MALPFVLSVTVPSNAPVTGSCVIFVMVGVTVGVVAAYVVTVKGVNCESPNKTMRSAEIKRVKVRGARRGAWLKRDNMVSLQNSFFSF